jgi:hypothetical protein
MNDTQRKGLFAEAKALLQRAQELLLNARAKHEAKAAELHKKAA